jgi:hypothetical protein
MPPKDHSRISFNIEKEKHKELKRVLIDKEQTITEFLIECINKAIQRNNKEE